MARASWRRRAALGVAPAGVLAGHRLTYRLAIPAAPERAAALAHSGHGYLAFANEVGSAVALAALAAIFLGGMTHRDGPIPAWARLFGQLALFQAAAFAGMETLERLASGAPLGGLLAHGLLVLGLMAQVTLAAIGSAAIRWLLRAARDVEPILDAVIRPRSAAGVIAVAHDRVLGSAWRPSAGIRGPPVPRATD